MRKCKSMFYIVNHIQHTAVGHLYNPVKSHANQFTIDHLGACQDIIIEKNIISIIIVD